MAFQRGEQVARTFEIVVTALILLFLGPLIAVERFCKAVLWVLSALRFDELLAFLGKVMTGEERLFATYNRLLGHEVSKSSRRL